MAQVRDDVRDAAPAEATAEPALAPPSRLSLNGVSNAALARALRAGGGAGLWRAAAGMPNSVRRRMLQREPPTATEVPAPPDVGRGGPHAYEYAFKHKVGDRASITFKLAFNPTEHKVAGEEKVKTEGGGAKAGVGFWESKVARERSGGTAATKLTDSLLKASAAVETPIPGLVVEAQTKLFEAQVEAAKSEADINAIVVSFAIKGDVTQWMSDDAGVPEAERAKWTITASGEAKVAPSLADLARIRDMWRAKQQMKAASEAIETAAKRAEAVQKELRAAEGQIKTLEKELKEFQGYGKQQKKRYPTRKAYEEAKAAKKAALAEKKAAKAALEAEKKTLKQTLKTQTEALKKATGVMEKAAAGLKSKAGRAMGKVLATQAGKMVARALAKAIPIINILSLLWDIKEIAVALYKISQGAEIGFGAGGEGGEGDGGEGDAGIPGGAGEEAGAPGDGGDTGTDAGTDTGTDAGTDAGADTGADAGTGSEGEPAAEPPATELNPNAKAVVEAMKGGTIALDDDMRRHLDYAVPADLTADQVAELVKRIQARIGGTEQDPYEIIGMIQEEAERIRRGGEEKVETWVDGELQPDSSQAPESEPGVDSGTGTAPPPKEPAKAEPPKSLMPKLPPVLTWDDKAKEFAWKPGGEEYLTGETYTIGDGLKVGINRAVLTNDKQGKLVLGTFSMEIMVDELPPGAGADYPWKVGDTRFYTLRFFRNVETGEMGEISEDEATTSAFQAALDLKGGVFSLKRKGALIETPSATLRLDSIAHQSKQDAGDNVIYTIGIVVTPTALKTKNAGLVDATGTAITFTVGSPVTVQLQLTGPK